MNLRESELTEITLTRKKKPLRITIPSQQEAPTIIKSNETKTQEISPSEAYLRLATEHERLKKECNALRLNAKKKWEELRKLFPNKNLTLETLKASYYQDLNELKALDSSSEKYISLHRRLLLNKEFFIMDERIQKIKNEIEDIQSLQKQAILIKEQKQLEIYCDELRKQRKQLNDPYDKKIQETKKEIRYRKDEIENIQTEIVKKRTCLPIDVCQAYALYRKSCSEADLDFLNKRCEELKQSQADPNEIQTINNKIQAIKEKQDALMSSLSNARLHNNIKAREIFQKLNSLQKENLSLSQALKLLSPDFRTFPYVKPTDSTHSVYINPLSPFLFSKRQKATQAVQPPTPSMVKNKHRKNSSV